MKVDLVKHASGWTVETLAEYERAVRDGDREVHAERDRRYAEVALEREKALKIKETADLAALQLAREIQTYKDEKANELRSQIERERGSYVTKPELSAAIEKIELVLKPLNTYMTTQQGRSQGIGASAGAVITIISSLAGVVIIVNLVIYFATHH